jgi:hypothetical protein
MPGKPCIITACHPVKNATDDNLIPRGGGAFLNEVDGNLTACATEGSVEVHTQGKFRGPDFAPLSFLLKTVTHERLKDSKGRLIPTVVASPLSEQAREDITKVVRSREDELLVALLDPANRKASRMELARRLSWVMRDGKPYHVLVGRILKALEKDKLITLERGEITLTKKGGEAARELQGKTPREDEKRATWARYFKLVGAEPDNVPCEHCDQCGKVYLIRDNFKGVESHALHEECAKDFYGR